MSASRWHTVPVVISHHRNACVAQPRRVIVGRQVAHDDPTRSPPLQPLWRSAGSMWSCLNPGKKACSAPGPLCFEEAAVALSLAIVFGQDGLVDLQGVRATTGSLSACGPGWGTLLWSAAACRMDVGVTDWTCGCSCRSASPAGSSARRDQGEAPAAGLAADLDFAHVGRSPLPKHIVQRNLQEASSSSSPRAVRAELSTAGTTGMPGRPRRNSRPHWAHQQMPRQRFNLPSVAATPSWAFAHHFEGVFERFSHHSRHLPHPQPHAMDLRGTRCPGGLGSQVERILDDAHFVHDALAHR